MGALDQTRLTPFAGLVPARGSYGIKANVRILKGAQVAIDSAGRAMPAGLVAAGALFAVGKSSAEYDNRTNSPYLSGSADACQVAVEFGTFGYVSATGGGDDIAIDDVGKVCYMVDDQTVALTNGTDTRGIAGYIVEVRDGLVWVQQGPSIASQIVIAASEASQLDTAQADIDALQLDAATTNAYIPIALRDFLDADGDPLVKFAADNVGTVGYNLADSEAVNLRWNNYPSNPGLTVICEVPMPYDVDPAADMILELLCSKSGATVGDATKFTYQAYFVTAGDLHDADTIVTGDTSALVGNATAKTTALITATIGAADVPVGVATMTLKLFPKSGLIETDDVMLHAARLRYTRKIQTS